MNLFERTILALAPGWAATRARSRALVAHFDGAAVGRRTASFRASRADADAAGRQRGRLWENARDMVRNTPFATRAKQVIAGNVVGDGVIPKVSLTARAGSRPLSKAAAKKIRARGLQLIEDHLDTVQIDRAGRLNFYGLQRLAMATVVESGECLIRLHFDHPDPAALPLQLEVLEPDYLDSMKFGLMADGNEIRDGIEYDRRGTRVAYWLFPQHPGSDSLLRPPGYTSVRVPADEVLHLYWVDRPGQQRGVSWFAPVMLRLQDLADHEDAQLMRQKIAACFAVFRVQGASEGGTDRSGDLAELSPGMIYELGDGEDVKFSDPPTVEGYDEFTKSVLRSVAAGLGVTYEALTGDLSQVSFSSGRMGRLEMDQNVSAWQWLMLIPQMLAPLSRHFVEAWQAVDAEAFAAAGLPADLWQSLRLEWAPPKKFIVDPAREFAALREAVRSGFASRQQIVRMLGLDPERLLEEQAQDRDEADRLRLPFDSDPRADPNRKADPVPDDETKVVAYLRRMQRRHPAAFDAALQQLAA